MDIHKPKHPIDSLRAFGAEIVTVTVGILIALGMEGVVQMAQHQQLAHQARADFRRELTEIRAQVEHNRAGFAVSKGDFAAAKAFLEARVENRTDIAPLKSMKLSTGFMTLSSSAWDTAQATQALSHMRPDETQALAAVRSDETAFQTLEAQALAAGIAVSGLVGDPAHYDRGELRAAYGAVSANYSILLGIDDLEAHMLVHIDKALKVLKD